MRPWFQRWLSGLLCDSWRELGWDAAVGESDDTRVRRAAILRIIGEIARDAEIAEQARARFQEYLANRTAIEPNLTDSLVAIVARQGDAQQYDRFLEAAEAARTPQERRRFQMSLAEFTRPQLVARTLSLVLTGTIATQDVGILLVRMFGNRAGRERTWEFMKKRWTALSKRLPPMMVSRVIDATPALKTRVYKRDVAQFFRTHPVPTARRALQQAFERFDLNEEFRRRAAKNLRRWLEARG